MVLVSAILLLDCGALLLLIMLSLSYGDVTDLLEDDAYQRFERSITFGWWLWWGVNVGLLALLLHQFCKQRAAVSSAAPRR